jgi:hypothetical protein
MTMPTPPTGDAQFRNMIVRIAELTVNAPLLDGLEFSNCRIIGPAVLALLNDVTITGCRWDAPDLRSLFWLVTPDRPTIVGAVGVRNCIFSSCAFEQVGIAGPPELEATLRSGFSN